MSKKYDSLVIGPVSLDHNIDYLGNERKEVGGAVVASGFAAARSGKIKTLVSMVGLCVMMVLPYAWIDWTVTIVIVVTTLYSGVEYFIQNWNCLWD